MFHCKSNNFDFKLAQDHDIGQIRVPVLLRFSICAFDLNYNFLKPSSEFAIPVIVSDDNTVVFVEYFRLLSFLPFYHFDAFLIIPLGSEDA